MGRTLAEYSDAFGQLSDQVLSRPFNTKAEARHLVALANQAVRKARDVFTFEITQTWKEGFKVLKAENDRLQLENSETYHNDIVSADTHFKEALAMGPPEGTSRAMFEKGWRYDHQGLLTGARLDRANRVKAITKAWKDGFAALKVENDQMQKDLAKAYRDELQMIDERLGDMYEGLQA